MLWCNTVNDGVKSTSVFSYSSIAVIDRCSLLLIANPALNLLLLMTDTMAIIIEIPRLYFPVWRSSEPENKLMKRCLAHA